MVVVVNYGVGNLGSILNMLKKAGVSAKVSSQPEDIAAAERIILPGVGAFDRAMERLTASGLIPHLEKRAFTDKIPFLGICVGMQLLHRRSEEGVLPGLGWLDADVVRFHFSDPTLRIPHMGWNAVESKDCPLLKGMEQEARFYFAHSFHTPLANEPKAVGQTKYGYPFASIVNRDNIWGAQFHPEKSHRYGLQFFRNFMEIPV